MILQLDWEFGTCPIWLQEEQSLTLFSMTQTTAGGLAFWQNRPIVAVL